MRRYTNTSVVVRLLNLYDLAHYFTIAGPRLRRQDVVGYLERGRQRRKAQGACTDSRLRAYDRARAALRSEGYDLVAETDPSGESFLTFPQAAVARAVFAERLTEEQLQLGANRRVLEAIQQGGQDGVSTRDLRLLFGSKHTYTALETLAGLDLIERVPHASDANRYRVTSWALERARGVA